MPEIQIKTLEKSLTNGGKDATIGMGVVVQGMNDGASVNLDNANNGAQPIKAQVPLEYTTPDGCHVKLTFRKESKPGVREEIARLLLDAFEERVRRQ